MVRFILGPSATGTYYAAVTGTLHSATNVTASGTNVLLSYRVQLPTIGTNSAGAAWWYTVYFEKSGHRYWTGAGELYIVKTSSTDADGLTWQEVITG